MTKEEYMKAVEPLLKVCLPISDGALDTHYQGFKDVDIKIFRKAVDEVRGTHEGSWFPMPATFERAIGEVSGSSQHIYEDEGREVRCKKCADVGVTLQEKKYRIGTYIVAVPCDKCEVGDRWRRNWERLDKKKRGVMDDNEDQGEQWQPTDATIKALVKDTAKRFS